MQTLLGSQPVVTAFVLAQLRVLSDEADEVEQIAAARFERAGGPAETWPGQWLG